MSSSSLTPHARRVQVEATRKWKIDERDVDLELFFQVPSQRENHHPIESRLVAVSVLLLFVSVALRMNV